MRRTLLLVAASAAVLLMIAAPGVAKTGGGAEVAHFDELPCQVAWYPTADPFALNDPACQVHNVRTPNGAYHLVLHGQIPDEFMDDFIADGTPRTHEGACLANYGILVANYGDQSNWPPDWSDGLTTSIRRFTPDGKMTEVCHLNP